MNNLGFHCHDVDLLEALIPENGLNRGEFYNLPSDDIPRMKRLIEQYKLHWSIHTPLIELDWYPKPPTWSFLCDPDKDKRELTMKMVNLTMDHADDYGAEYVVVHLPASMDDDDSTTRAERESIAWRSCDRLAELSLKRKIPIHIEGVGTTSLINTKFLSAVLKEYSPLRYCFDTAHSNLAAIQNGFDLYDLQCDLLPYLGSLHIWNTRGKDDYRTFHHVPVHPSQSVDDGWVDIPRVLQALGSQGCSLPIVFESIPSYPEELGNYDYREGVEWVKQLLATLS